MYTHSSEDVAWERLKDLQREMENAHRLASGEVPATLVAVWRLAKWLGANTRGLALRLVVRPSKLTVVADDSVDQPEVA